MKETKKEVFIKEGEEIDDISRKYSNKQSKHDPHNKRVKRERELTKIPPHLLDKCPSYPVSLPFVSSPSFSLSPTSNHPPLQFHDETGHFEPSLTINNPSPSSPLSSPPPSEAMQLPSNNPKSPPSPFSFRSLPPLSSLTHSPSRSSHPSPSFPHVHPLSPPSPSSPPPSKNPHSPPLTLPPPNSSRYSPQSNSNDYYYHTNSPHNRSPLFSASPYLPHPKLLLDPSFSEDPKCHVTDFVVSLFERSEKSDSDESAFRGIRTRTFQLFASRCIATCARMDALYTLSRTQAVLDALQTLRHPNLATPTAHFPRGGLYYAVYPLFTGVKQGSELSVKEKEMLRSGLRSLHSVGLRHGDVQVRNVVRDEDGNPMLAYCERALIENELSIPQDLHQFENNIPPILNIEKEDEIHSNSNSRSRKNSVHMEWEPSENIKWHVVDEAEIRENRQYWT